MSLIMDCTQHGILGSSVEVEKKKHKLFMLLTKLFSLQFTDFTDFMKTVKNQPFVSCFYSSLSIYSRYVFNSIKGFLLGSPLTNKLVSVNLVYENIPCITTAQSKEAKRRAIHRHTSFICEPTSVMNV